MPSHNTYRLTWVSLTLDMGYFFMAAPAKRSHCSLPWTRGISSQLPLLTLKGATPRPRSGGCSGTGGPRGATPHSRSGVMTSSKVRNSGVLCWSSHGEIPHIQGKRNPRKMVGIARGHQRADTLKPYSQKLVNLITVGPQPCLTQ